MCRGEGRKNLTSLIQQKILKDRENCLHRPILVQLGHDLLLVGRDTVRASTWEGHIENISVKVKDRMERIKRDTVAGD